MKRMIGTLFFLLFAPKALYTFNIDTKIKVVFQNHDNILFGQKVVQYNHDENSGILVSSPLYTKDNKSYGRMENCDLKSKRCNPIKLPETRSARRRPGFTMVANLLHSQFLLCQQQRIRLQKNIEDLNGICTVLSSKLQEQYTIETSSLGIVTQNNNNNNGNNNNNNNNNNEEDDDDDFPGTEIAIVLDGSGSIDESDFRIAKDFIKNIARNIGDKCPECTFALVQYGGDIETIFNLKESKAMGSRIFKVVDDMPQFGFVTKTASAIQHVLDNIFNETQGSKRYAKQFLIVITDGEINGDKRNITDVINSPKIAKVTRIAVGVGESFQDDKALNELKLIATDPDEKHLFQVDNYAALNNLLGDLEKNIVGIEGTQGPNISAFHLELAQMGFSADYSSDGNILLGAVGAYDWTGGVMMYNIKNGTTQFLNESTRTLSTAYGYLGYSVTGAKGSYLQHLYIAGAPRRNQTGQVIVFEAGTPVKIKQYLSGHQLGSYFGSELCPLDINGDSVTDLLLVGAPFFHVRGEEGMVYVYHRNEQGLFDDEMTLTGVGSATNARFGFAIANIGDINKDGLNDVAIGAPLEDDHGGSIYIFNGKIDDIHKTYSQRIQGKDVMSGLQYFGQSIDGASDVDGDGLIDITVGAKDNVVVLSSRPVIDIEVEVTFSPKMVPLSFATSNEQKKTIQVSVCFVAVSQFRTLDLKNSFVNYTINLDKNQKNKRAMFTKSDATPVSLSDSVRISTAACKNYSITLQHCTTDCVSAIDVEVNYTLHNIEEKDQPPSPILDKSTKPLASFELQFQKDCGSDDICDSNLFMDCNFTNDFTWIVGKTREASLKIFLSNTGEDSYLTTMDLSYPKSFYFKEISKSQSSQLIGVKCTDQAASSSLSFLKCAISHPVFKKNSQAELTVSWDLDIAPFKEEFATISINVSNTNEVEDFIQWTHYIPTRHVLNVFLRPLNQISKVNIHGKDVNRPVTFNFQATVDNPYNAVIKLRISIPVKVQQLDILDSEHLKAQKHLKDCLEVRNIKKHKNSQKGKDKWDCDMEECECLYFECVLTASKQDVIVTANLIKDNLKQLIPEKADIVVSGSVVFDRNLYQESHDAEDQGHNVEIYVNVVNVPAFNVIPLVAGSTVGGILLLLLVIFILYKCGFFKRSYKDKIELEE